uniref:Transposase n=1 Tax=Panagrolaimus sp. ES5 TaxID=591445 RepID=A0AC34G7T9_9BILA
MNYRYPDEIYKKIKKKLHSVHGVTRQQWENFVFAAKLLSEKFSPKSGKPRQVLETERNDLLKELCQQYGAEIGFFNNQHYWKQAKKAETLASENCIANLFNSTETDGTQQDTSRYDTANGSDN